MRRSIALGAAAVGGAAVGVCMARGPFKAHLAEGTLPGRCGSWANSYLNRPSYRLMAAALQIGPQDEVLDLACGSGEFLAVHAAQAQRVVGIDISRAKTELACERLAERIASGSAEVVQGDAASLPWQEGVFTAVTCMDAFPFFPNPDQVLAEAFRVLRPGGRVVMQIGMKWPHGRPKHVPFHPATKLDVSDEAAVVKLVENAGFVEVSASYGPVGGGSCLGNLLSRLLGGSDQLRLVTGVKPA